MNDNKQESVTKLHLDPLVVNDQYYLNVYYAYDISKWFLLLLLCLLSVCLVFCCITTPVPWNCPKTA